LGLEGNSVTEGGGLGVVDEKHRYIEQTFSSTDCL
jgi:hypothetical protein